MEGIDEVLEKVFQTDMPGKQPRYIVELDCEDGSHLRRAYSYVKAHTARGKRLDDYPLTLVALYSDPSKKPEIAKELEGIPHKLEMMPDKKSPEKAFKEGASLSLFLDFSKRPAVDFSALETMHGIVRAVSKSNLLEYARIGFFPKHGRLHDKIIHFEKRPYQARLEGAKLLFESAGKECGFLSFLRIPTTNNLLTEELVETLEDTKGPVLHIKECSFKQYEEQTLEFFIQWAFGLEGIKEVSAALSCLNYPGSDIISMPSYVEELKQEKGAADFATRLHVRLGAKIVKCLPNYRPQDKKNLGSVVLVVYSPDSLPEYLLQSISFEREYTHESIERLVEGLIKAFGVRYEPTKTLVSMGLSDVRQLELRANLSKDLELDLPSNFFVLHTTPERIIKALVESKFKIYQEWFYEIEWHSTQKPDIITLAKGQKWAVDGDKEASIAQSCIELLHEYGQQTTATPADADHVLFIYCENWLGRMTALIKSLASCINPPKLWVVAEYMAVDGHEKSLRQWPLNALCKVIREEYPKLECRYIAVDPSLSGEDNAELVFDEIRARASDPEVAFRQGQRVVPQLKRAAVQAVKRPYFSSKATYLVAGGLRPLGIFLARWYATHGAKHIVLLDEIEESPEVKSVRSSIEKMGVTTTVCMASLGDEAEVVSKVGKILETLPPLKGILHAAGLVDNDLLLHMTQERFEAVHRVKISLSWALHTLSSSLDIDHFVLFSSCLADISPLAKANHATGNSYLDALAHYRYKRGLPALVVDWGPWELAHMQVRHIAEASLTEQVRTLRIDKGLELLDYLFSFSRPQVWAASINWPVVLQSVAEENSFFNEIAYELGLKRMSFLKGYFSLPQDERQAELEGYIHERIRTVLKLPSSQLLEKRIDLKKLGVDTSKKMALRNLIQRDLQGTVTVPLLFVEENSTIEQLAKALQELLEKVFCGATQGAVLSSALIGELQQRLKAKKPLPTIIVLEDS